MPSEGVAARTRVRDLGCDIVDVVKEGIESDVGWEGSGAWVGCVGEM